MGLISDLNPAAALDGTETVHGYQGGNSRKITTQQIKTFASAGGGAVYATIAALMAVQSQSLSNGQRAYVTAYDATTGQGGGWFRWDSASTATTDGGVTFVPDNLTATATEETVTYANVNATSGYHQLAHTGIVWGSFSATYANTLTVGSKWLHGHAVPPRHASGAAINENTLLDHANGRMHKLSGFRWRNLVATNTDTHVTESSRTMAVNYRYTTGAGRWIREGVWQAPLARPAWATPAMFGGKRGDSRFDNSFAVCWALNWLRDQGGGTLQYDAAEDEPYYILGMWGEVYSHIRQVGIGQDAPCVRYFGEDPASPNSGGAIDFLQSNYLLANAGYLAAGGTDPYRLLQLHNTTQVQFDRSGGQVFEDFCVDGNYAENLYVLDNPGGLWDVTPLTGTLSQNLRESPSYSGFWCTSQSGRYFGEKQAITVRDPHWHGMWGTCFGGAGGGIVKGHGLKVGNSVSGRTLYGGHGPITGVVIYGFTRSSYASPSSGDWTGIVIRDTAPNPWKANAIDPAFIANRGASDSTWEDWLSDESKRHADEKFGERLFSARGVTIDMTGVSSTAPFRWQSGLAEVSGFNIKGPGHSNRSNLLLRETGDNGNDSVATPGPLLRDGKFRNRSFQGLHWVDDETIGQSANGVMRDVTITETYATKTEFTHSHDMTDAVWTKTGVSVSANQSNDPYGNATLDRLTEDTSTGLHQVSRAFTTTTNKTYVFSAWARSPGRDIYLSTPAGYVIFDVSAEAFDFVDPNYSADFAGYGYEEPESGLYLVWVKWRETSGQSRTWAAGLANGATAAADASYTGDGASYIDVGAIRLEESDDNPNAYPGPPIVIGASADTGGQKATARVLPKGNGSFGFKLVMEPEPSAGEFVSDQRWTFANVKDETVKQHIGQLAGGETANNVDTVIRLENCQIHTQTNRWFRTDLTNGLQNAVNLTIIMDGCEVETYDTTASSVGTLTDFRNGCAKVIMRNCRTSGGRTSEMDELVTLAVVASSPGDGEVDDSATTIDFETPLMMSPLSYDVSALSADARSAGITSVTVVATASNDALPIIRIGVGTLTAGETLTYRITAAVLPPRSLA